MKLPRVLGLSVLLAVTIASSEEAKTYQPIAIVYSLAGKASLTSPGQARRPLRLFDRLPAGTIVELGLGSRLSLGFANGLRYELGERSRVALGAKDLAARSGPVRALPKVPPLPQLAPIAPNDNPGGGGGGVPIRGEGIMDLYPRDGVVTLASATVLQFKPLAGVVRYRISVQDRQGKMIFEVETPASAVTLAAGILQSGQSYEWMVRTVERAGPVAEGKEKLVTVSAEIAEKREALRKALISEGDGASWALLAEVDRGLGLLAEARDELQAAAQRLPGDDLLAAKLAELERLLPDRQSP